MKWINKHKWSTRNYPEIKAESISPSIPDFYPAEWNRTIWIGLLSEKFEEMEYERQIFEVGITNDQQITNRNRIEFGELTRSQDLIKGFVLYSSKEGTGVILNGNVAPYSTESLPGNICFLPGSLSLRRVDATLIYKFLYSV